MDGGGLGGFPPDAVVEGDCRVLIPALPDASIDIVISSPPYWGQRTSAGNGVEADPRRYVGELADAFAALLPKVKPDGVLWINLGDAYNTPVNWRSADYSYSTLGPARARLSTRGTLPTPSRGTGGGRSSTPARPGFATAACSRCPIASWSRCPTRAGCSAAR